MQLINVATLVSQDRHEMLPRALGPVLAVGPMLTVGVVLTVGPVPRSIPVVAVDSAVSVVRGGPRRSNSGACASSRTAFGINI